MNNSQNFHAHTGLTLPPVGFGTYKLKGADGARSIHRAVSVGYRLLDSAYNYENEGTVGEGIRRVLDATDVTREDLIVQSKLPGRYQQADLARQTIEESLFRTGLDYLDLYLIHWPNPKQGLFVEAWNALRQARDEGLIRHIGVCNFLPEHLNELERQTGELPAVNQIELHPRFPQIEALEFHHRKGIITQAWSPLLRGGVLDAPEVTAISESHGCTPGQVVLAWHRQRGSLAIPKAQSEDRQKENFASQNIVLTAEELSSITNLGRPDGRMKGQNPAEYEEF